jgi:hypothetical protein
MLGVAMKRIKFAFDLLVGDSHEFTERSGALNPEDLRVDFQTRIVDFLRPYIPLDSDREGLVLNFRAVADTVDGEEDGGSVQRQEEDVEDSG